MEPPPGAAENSKLRHVEKDVLIPQIMKERAKELCSDKVQGNSFLLLPPQPPNPHCYLGIFSPPSSRVQGMTQHAFTKCCQETGLLMVVKCRQENTALKDCLVG
ncbi:COX assembly mitochondrial protein homolog isoform 4-T4 [Chlamydotis macqueenii]